MVWWAIALAVALSILPLARPTRAALVTGSFLAGLAAFTALSITWSDGAERAFAELNRVCLSAGVFALAVLASRPADLRRWRDGIAIGITAIGVLALASRLFSGLVDERKLFQFLPGGETRLSYPLDYWNGLGIFVALAFPLLLAIATEARNVVMRALAVASLPALTATIYLTSSRGAAATAAVGIVAFLALTGRRLVALGAIACAAAGSALVVAVLLARDQLVDGPLQSGAANSQGHSAAILIALACLGSGVLLLAGTRLAPRRLPRPSPALRRGLALAGVAAVLGGVVAIDPIDRFDTFRKSPTEFQQPQGDFTRAHLLSGSGSGRWQFWQAAVDEYETRPLVGRGAGSYEAWWARHGTLYRFIRDAHSIYLETLAELGLIGLVLLLGLLGSGLVVAVGRLRAAADDRRVTIASLTALFLAWSFSAGIDWMWELTAVTVVAIAALALMVGPAAAPAPAPAVSPATEGDGRRSTIVSGSRRYLAAQIGVVAIAVLVIATEAAPLLAHKEIRSSQAAVARGDGNVALDHARDARRLEPWASSPRLQLALVEEQMGNLRSARTDIAEAIDRDSTDWRLWLVQARLEVKDGAPGRARRSLARARTLNPRSPLFAKR